MLLSLAAGNTPRPGTTQRLNKLESVTEWPRSGCATGVSCDWHQEPLCSSPTPWGSSLNEEASVGMSQSLLPVGPKDWL